jgi:hypothetical protein
MSNDTTIIELTPENASEYGCPCFLNPQNKGHRRKLEWLRDRFSEGMKIKLLFLENEKKPIGFIEYTPGEYTWRAVSAPQFLFIHCIWISPKKYREQGFGSQLVESCIEDARIQDKRGVAVITSTGAFMAETPLFLKNGFISVDEESPYSLLVFSLKEGLLPVFKDWKTQLNTYKGLHLLYTNQCPWVARSIGDYISGAAELGLQLMVTELKTAQEAQNAPSIYATLNLIYNGKLLADHYISQRRFLNILKKEVI